ncbi:glycosyltransferase [Rhodoblastus acidophilus]|uniref:Glycosyltransferase n=1 Tax=Candidatus Rhodoblastus alkanivorans TaxID=2954117 RepID=A0ABS9Z7F4_9HYPH|nr:glycosyltransferase [Candidatus Rhodoblastus alkanivorans]MCI4678365.1 glycosyltransferase [Candidatus Rhodoblastus alkanivorans]MCI4683623.1 glycosyltransferase [Candidatus Rhodoblastus alkanivorans]MDI4640939.1 glycosyltransferase [Rhodoblastus acidophilus]
MTGPSSDGKPLLSIIMPVFRGEELIGEALESVATEVPPEARGKVEILVIDSSPDDATMNVVRRFEDRLNLRPYDRPDFPMWHAKTNFAVQEARADHLCWLHHDDLWLPGRMKAVESWIAAAPEAPFHFAPSVFVDAAGTVLGEWNCPIDEEGPQPRETFLRGLLVQNYIAAPAPVFRKDAWLRCGGLDETLWYTADWDIWLKLTAQGGARFHKEVATAFRVHGSSLTVTGSRDIADFVDQMRVVLDRHITLLPENRRREIAPVCAASILVNEAVARASRGDASALLRATAATMKLGPRGVATYLRHSRLGERVSARVRAKMRGGM